MLGLQPPRLGPHLEHADRRGVVDEHARLGQGTERVRQPAVVLLAEKSGAEAVGVDASLRRQQPHEQLLLRHLEAEEADRHLGRGADVLRDVEHETRLAHRRPGGHEHQVGRLQPRGHLVQVDEPGGHTGDQALVLLQLLDGAEAALDEVAQRHEPGADPVLCDRENRALRLIEQQVWLLLGLVRLDEDLVGRVDQIAQRRLFLDDPRVVLDVRRPRHAIGERRDVGRAADVVEVARARQLFLQRDEIDRIAALAEHDHLVEDAPVRIPEEVARVDQLRGVVERVVVDQNCAEHGLFGVEIVRKSTFWSGGLWHERMTAL